MERLTFDGNFCDIAQCRELPCPHGGSCTQRKVWEKLKAYEDSGFTPVEIKSLYAEWDVMMSVLNSIGGGYERLRELAEADKDGGEEDVVETVPVVRCENCLYWVSGKNECESWEWCKMLNTDMPPNGFCYLGDRKDEARNER